MIKGLVKIQSHDKSRPLARTNQQGYSIIPLLKEALQNINWAAPGEPLIVSWPLIVHIARSE